MGLRGWAIASAALVCSMLVGCGSPDEALDPADAQVRDASSPSPDAANPNVDAGAPPDATAPRPDAEPPGLELVPATEVVGGAGRLSGPTFRMEAQIGHPIQQRPTAGASGSRLEGNAAIKR